MEERLEETDDGYYIRNGDVLEWQWKDKPKAERNVVTTETAEEVVPPKAKKAAKK